MTAAAAEILAFLDAHAVSYTLYRHPAAETIADCRLVSEDVGRYVCKNWFLASRSGSVHCVCVVRPEARLVTSSLSKQVGSPRLSFGSDAELAALLHTYPGAVNPLGLVFPEARGIRLLIDSRILSWPKLAFHPCENTASLVFTHEAFFDGFLKAAGITAEPVDIPETM